MKIKPKMVGVITVVFSPIVLLAVVGCEPAPMGTKLSGGANNNFNASIHGRYAPVKIDIMQLTEFVHPSDSDEPPKIRVYVSLLDSFGCQIKYPAVFRFELYEKVPRSGEPKGKRITIWPDIDLTRHSENNKYWQDFLRAYEFNLDFPPLTNKDSILQVTSLCSSGRRLSAEFDLKQTRPAFGP